MPYIRCSYCKKKIKRCPYDIKKYKQLFCSKECHNKSMERRKTVKCAFCKKKISRPLSMIFDSNFCSNECRRKWLGKRNTEVLNVKGHTKGHKALHLTVMNKLKNPCGVSIAKQKHIDSSVYRKIVEKAIGRKLKKGEVVHHKNGIRTDNRLSNLQVLTISEHSRVHMQIAYKNYLKRKKKHGKRNKG